MGGPPPSLALTIVDQKGSKLIENILILGPRGEERSSITYDTEAPVMNSMNGLPMRTKASWVNGTLVSESKVASSRPLSIGEKARLSPDGATLTVDVVMTADGKETRQTVVFEKQPDSAGEPCAVRGFKNVQLLKDLPVSRFLDAMNFFGASLGVSCEHCHVRGQFYADDKPSKGTARKMIAMTNSINEQSFAGKMEVRCFTCHRGKLEPQPAPAFE